MLSDGSPEKIVDGECPGQSNIRGGSQLPPCVRCDTPFCRVARRLFPGILTRDTGARLNSHVQGSAVQETRKEAMSS